MPTPNLPGHRIYGNINLSGGSLIMSSVQPTQIAFGHPTTSGLTGNSSLIYSNERLVLLGYGGSIQTSIGAENGWGLTAPQGFLFFSPSGKFNHSAIAHNFYFGNVGIGTESNYLPTNKLEVIGDVSITGTTRTNILSATSISASSIVTDAFKVGTIEWYPGDYLYGGASLQSFITLSAGVAQIGHFANRTLYQNGVGIVTYVNSVETQRQTNALTTISTDSVLITGTTNTNSLSAITLSASTIQSSTLTGTTDRMVQADSGGTFSATKQIISAYGLSDSVKTLLTATTNWSPTGQYTGATITGTYQGQKHYNSSYFFEAVENDIFIRLQRV